jgi:hypothetical protein
MGPADGDMGPCDCCCCMYPGSVYSDMSAAGGGDRRATEVFLLGLVTDASHVPSTLSSPPSRVLLGGRGGWGYE